MLKILQLPHSKTLKKVIRGGSEQSGIDEDYLQGQQQIYEQFKSGWEAEGHPRPLGIGVLMSDEVKGYPVVSPTGRFAYGLFAYE